MIRFANTQAMLTDLRVNSVYWIVTAGVPDATSGVGVCGPGSLCSDITNKDLYINAGTKAVPDWKLVTRAA